MGFKNYNIHATNINGLGAINVANKIINSLLPYGNINKIYCVNGNLNKDNKYFIYKRILPNSILAMTLRA